MSTPTPERLAKLPVWAQDFIASIRGIVILAETEKNLLRDKVEKYRQENEELRHQLSLVPATHPQSDTVILDMPGPGRKFGIEDGATVRFRLFDGDSGYIDCHVNRPSPVEANLVIRKGGSSKHELHVFKPEDPDAVILSLN